MFKKLIKLGLVTLCAAAILTALPFSASAKPKKLSKSVKVGDTVYFGKYEQDGNKENGKEKIEWKVLSKKGKKALLISKDILDIKPYHKEYVDITWEDSSIRKWLNHIFLNAAFTNKEKKRIIKTTVVNKDNEEYETKGGNDTKDKVFLLSIDEAKRYFRTDEERIASLTAYSLSEKKRIGLEKEWWWLRSPGGSPSIAARVNHDGWVIVSGYIVFSEFEGVRPAIWVNL